MITISGIVSDKKNTKTTKKADRQEYTDAEYVDGVAKCNPKMQSKLYNFCNDYFNANYRGVFFCTETDSKDIFQEAFIVLWRKIERRKIYVEDGVLKNVTGKPFTCKLKSYFMSIAKYKYLEFCRDNELCVELLDELVQNGALIKDIDKGINDMLYDDPTKERIEVIAECISVMSKQCNQVLTKFYFEEKTLDEILIEMSSFKSKDALKTHKYKCMETLRNNALEMYKNMCKQ